jgi:hypothetical protein
MNKPWLKNCWQWQPSDIPLTLEEFTAKFFPQSLREPSRPIGGFSLNKHGRPVNHNSKSARKGRATRFQNRIAAAYAEYRSVHPNKS